MVKEPNAGWHNSGHKDCLVFIGVSMNTLNREDLP